MNIEAFFFNQFGRLRSGWRFALFLLAFIFIGGLLGSLAVGAFSAAGVSFEPGNLLSLLVNSSISLFAALLVGWLCGKILEGLPFRALGAWFTGNWARDLCWGLVFGAFSILLATGVAFALGGLRFQWNQNHGSSAILLTMAVSFVVFAVAAAFEEAFFRGYILQTFARARLAWPAIVLTSVFFAFAHYGNPGATVFSIINTGLAGIWLGVAYLKTRNLGFPFGIHLMWNWMQGAFLGVEVSGLKQLLTAPLLQEVDAGPVWLTGSDYGLEGGLACTIALVVSTALIWYLPFLKPTDEMLALTSAENPRDEAALA
jgi:membrane protease YdiL (CAAX protease family)